MDWAELRQLATEVRWAYVLVALPLPLANTLLTAIKWYLLTRSKGLTVSPLYLIRIVWGTNFVNDLLPSTLATDNLRMWIISRGSRSVPEAISTVIVERITGLLSLCLMAAAGAFLVLERWGDQHLLRALIVPFSLVVVATSLVWTSQGVAVLRWLLQRFHWLPAHRFLEAVHRAVSDYRTQPGLILATTAISIVIQLTRVTAIYFLGRALGLKIGMGLTLTLVPTIIIVSMLPISVSDLGVQEGAFVVLLRLVHVGTPAAIGLSLLSRLNTLLANLPGGILLLARGWGRPAQQPVEAQEA